MSISNVQFLLNETFLFIADKDLLGFIVCLSHEHLFLRLFITVSISICQSLFVGISLRARIVTVFLGTLCRFIDNSVDNNKGTS